MNEGSTPEEGEPLVLRHDRVLSRVGRMFEAMKDDETLQAEFIDDPSQAIFSYMTGERLAPQRASISNQLLFSILGNEKLTTWLQGYSAGRGDDPPSRETFMRDFSQAIVAHGGDSAVLSLIRATLAQEIPLGMGEESGFLISSSPIIASGVAASTDQKQEQKQSAASDLRSSQNFAQSTQQDTPITSKADASGMFDPGIYESLHVRATIEALVSHATLLHERGRLRNLQGEFQR